MLPHSTLGVAFIYIIRLVTWDKMFEYKRTHLKYKLQMRYVTVLSYLELFLSLAIFIFGFELI